MNDYDDDDYNKGSDDTVGFFVCVLAFIGVCIMVGIVIYALATA